MVRRYVFQPELKENIVCHEVVDGGRTPSALGAGGGWLLVATVYVTYSLSVLVVRVSGTLPIRPMRTSFARSDAEGRDDENARNPTRREKGGRERNIIAWE